MSSAEVDLRKRCMRRDATQHAVDRMIRLLSPTKQDKEMSGVPTVK